MKDYREAAIKTLCPSCEYSKRCEDWKMSDKGNICDAGYMEYLEKEVDILKNILREFVPDSEQLEFLINTKRQ